MHGIDEQRVPFLEQKPIHNYINNNTNVTTYMLQVKMCIMSDFENMRTFHINIFVNWLAQLT